MQSLTDQSDEMLLGSMMAGDEDAFATIYRRRQPAIYRFALQMSGSVGIAEDVTQEVFVMLIQKPERYEPSRGPLTALLYGIARNLVLRRLGKDRAFVCIPEVGNEGELALPDQLICRENPLTDLTRNEVVSSVRRAILALPPHYREVVVLCELHEMSYREAAGVLGTAIGTVRSRLHRARRILIEKLRAVGETRPTETDVSPERCLA